MLVVVEEEGTLVEGEMSRAEPCRYGSRELCTPGGVCLCPLRSNREMDCLETITEWFRLRWLGCRPAWQRDDPRDDGISDSLEVFRRRWRLFRGT